MVTLTTKDLLPTTSLSIVNRDPHRTLATAKDKDCHLPIGTRSRSRGKTLDVRSNVHLTVSMKRCSSKDRTLSQVPLRDLPHLGFRDLRAGLCKTITTIRWCTPRTSRLSHLQKLLEMMKVSCLKIREDSSIRIIITISNSIFQCLRTLLAKLKLSNSKMQAEESLSIVEMKLQDQI